MLHILAIISPLFLIILLGFFLRKSKIADKNWQKVLNDFALKIGFPALIFLALAQTKFSLSIHSEILLINFIFLLTVISLFFFAGKILNYLPKRKKRLSFVQFLVMLLTSGYQLLPKYLDKKRFLKLV